MPYIEKSDRPNIDYQLTGVSIEVAKVFKRKCEGIPPQKNICSLLGILNFTITRLLVHVWRECELGSFRKYSNIAMITGVLENVKQEFYRRVAAPYEDEKLLENGDVYDD